MIEAMNGVGTPISDYRNMMCLFGIENDPVYDERTRYKLKTFKENYIDVISVYPSTLQGDYQEYIFNELHRNVSGRVSELERAIANYSSNRNSRPVFRSTGYGSRSSRY